jgi:hypothetical protein
MNSLQRLLCAVRGHEDYLHFETNRVYLQCVACGHQSPGWSVAERKAPLKLVRGVADAKRQRFAASVHQFNGDDRRIA